MIFYIFNKLRHFKISHNIFNDLFILINKYTSLIIILYSICYLWKVERVQWVPTFFAQFRVHFWLGLWGPCSWAVGVPAFSGCSDKMCTVTCSTIADISDGWRKTLNTKPFHFLLPGSFPISWFVCAAAAVFASDAEWWFFTVSSAAWSIHCLVWRLTRHPELRSSDTCACHWHRMINVRLLITGIICADLADPQLSQTQKTINT